jgi:tetratricopeptide (TPR) repeat protein
VNSRGRLAECHAELGTFAEGEALAEEGLRIRVAPALGAAYTLGGRAADAVPLLTQAMEQTIATEMVAYEVLCCLSLGEALALAGRLKEAHALAERALALAQEHQEPGHQAYALRLLGEITAQRTPPEAEQSEADHQHALVMANELGMRPLAAHCHLGLGMLYHQIGWHEEAQVALSIAVKLYRAMDMGFWIPQAERALGYGGVGPRYAWSRPRNS